ncbi:MAG: AarF/ABC1/UbiB kinase family protein [Myxococcales bacterium]|nr:AarF/ABC1/UbiB kinase family protein [Myxococcales bacterium]
MLITLAIIAAVVAVAAAATPTGRRLALYAAVAARRIVLPLVMRLDPRERGVTMARPIRMAFEDLGPAFVKFGQMIASTPTAFSQEAVLEFANCLDEVRPMSVRAVWQILSSELGRQPEEIFDTIDSTPLASASIAQVHAARLEDGTEVVVKVQRPGIDTAVERDLGLLSKLCGVAMRLSEDMRRANLTAVVEDFRKTIREEMDFNLEADNIEAFSEMLAREGLTHMARAPRVFRELTTRRVLTMERFYGVRIDDQKGVRERVADPYQLIRDTSEVFWTSVFMGGFFHGDIHAGNIMVLDDGTIGYIDFGIFGRFTPHDRVNLADWVAAMVSNNADQMARVLIAMGAFPRDVDFELFRRDVAEIFMPLRTIALEDTDTIENFFPRLRAMASRHNARLPATFVLILKQLMYFGRYVMMHAPGFNENTDPKSQQMFVKLMMKFNAWRLAEGGESIAITPVGRDHAAAARAI